MKQQSQNPGTENRETALKEIGLKSPDYKNKIRVFIAVPMPKNVNLFLGKIQGEIKENRFKASWTGPENIHLTLRFLGDIPVSSIDAVTRAMKLTGDACGPFNLSMGGVGVFPSVKRARVIWAGVRGQTRRLERVHNILQLHLEQEGFEPVKKSGRFSPHLTLGRFKGRIEAKALVEIIRRYQNHESERHLFKSMVLFKSDLKPSGAVHTPLYTATFSGNPVNHQIEICFLKKG